MRASTNWLRELSGVDASPHELAERLTSAGLEVESIEQYGDELDGVVVGEIRHTQRHPERGDLSIVRLDVGRGEIEVVCGAPNVPSEGAQVLVATMGCRLPNGLEVQSRRVAGVASYGMICGEEELGIGLESEGIVVLEEARPVGMPAAEALPLRDVILDIGVTPNRPDALGHVGLARELCALFGSSLPIPGASAPSTVAADREGPSLPDLDLGACWADFSSAVEKRAVSLSLEIQDSERCPRYGAAVVRNVRVGPSPFFVRHRLFRLGVRPINNVVDVTNWILLEWGQPIHAFDLSKIRGRRIVVRTAAPGERLATLDGQDLELTDSDLVICDVDRPVALAGVMGGSNSEVDEQTTDVLIECAAFDPASIRRTARRFGLHTESSHRFERGLDQDQVPSVLAAAVGRTQRASVGSIALRYAWEAHPAPRVREPIGLRFDRLRKLLGADVPAASCLEILATLGCEVVGRCGDSVDVRAPGWRPDLQREVDLIEEVARIWGYERIAAKVPAVQPSSEGTPPLVRFCWKLRQSAAAAGLDEAITFSFVSDRDLAAAAAPRAAVALANPLSEERAVMRTSLLPGLAEAARRSLRRGAERVMLFELGRVFVPGEAMPEERQNCAFIMSGPRRQWIGTGEAMDFYDAKGVAQAMIDALPGAGASAAYDASALSRRPALHPKRAALLHVAGSVVGAIGELHPDVVDAWDLVGRFVYGEVDVAALFDAKTRSGFPKAAPLPKFPPVLRDIALIVSEDFAAEEVARELASVSEGLAEEVILFDLYCGPPVPAGSRSLAFRITYRDQGKTLTDKRVDAVHAKLARAMRDRFNAVIR